MRSQKTIILTTVASCVLVILGTFIAAFIIGQNNKIGNRDNFTQTMYQPFTENNTQSKNDKTVEIEKGTYINGQGSVTINSNENGFIEGSVNDGNITMTFSGQAVDKKLTATGTDSLGNTVEITITFYENYLIAESKPIALLETAIDFMNISGTFTK